MTLDISNRTRSWDEALLNKNLSVELLGEVSLGGKLPANVFLYMLVAWKQQYEKSDWVAISGIEWSKRTGMERTAKHRATKSLVGLGYIQAKQVGHKSTVFQLTDKKTAITSTRKIKGCDLGFDEYEIVDPATFPDYSDYSRRVWNELMTEH